MTFSGSRDERWPETGALTLVGDPEQRGDLEARLAALLPG